jgi:hypothetical protein
VRNGEKFFDRLRNAQNPSRSCDRFRRIRPTLPYQTFDCFFFAKRSAALIAGSQGGGESKRFSAEHLSKPLGRVNSFPNPVKLGNDLGLIAGTMLERDSHEQTLQSVEPGDSEATAVEDFKNCVHCRFVVNLMEYEGEPVLYDPRELDRSPYPFTNLVQSLIPVRSALSAMVFATAGSAVVPRRRYSAKKPFGS